MVQSEAGVPSPMRMSLTFALEGGHRTLSAEKVAPIGLMDIHLRSNDS